MKRSDYIKAKKDYLLLERVLIEEYSKRLEKHSAKKGLRKISKEKLLTLKTCCGMQL